MPTELISRNTIKLSASASSVNDYYVGYTIIVTRFDSVTGKKTEQSREIVAYNGSTKVATIAGIWDIEFIPNINDTYKIVPTYPDSRVSTNFGIITLDYITSKRYGKGLDPFVDLDLPSWLESARICDTQSDVTVKVLGSTAGIIPGGIYLYYNGITQWQGTVLSVKENHVKFTNILGKLTHKWNSWKVFNSGCIIYEGNQLYIAQRAGPFNSKPSHTSGTVQDLLAINTLLITKIGGPGPSTIALVANENPVQDVNSRGIKISGYSLYDADGIDYWRYVGWDQHDQRFVTKHQGNLILDTSVPLFENTNSLLQHFGGIISYIGGKYSLFIEEAEGVIAEDDSEVKNITKEHTIGRIRLTDEGLRGAFNSLTVAYADPANKFEAKNISFFNSEFLKSDRNVPKKGNLSIPGVTNYYNARLLADKFLVKSRYGLTVSFNIAPRGLLLSAGSVIQLQNPRYGWVNKKFRIENITHNSDCTLDIVAKEYDDKFYVVSNISKPPAVVSAGEAHIATSLNPSGLTATGISSENETFGGIEVSWNLVPNSDSTVETELYSSFKAKLQLIGDRILNNIIRFNTEHGLFVGDIIKSKGSDNGLILDVDYYVKEVISDNEIKISESIDGPVKNLVAGTGLQLRFFTGDLIATLPSTTNSYIDTILNSNYVPPTEPSTDPEAPDPNTPEGLETLERVKKFYWIRNKITRI